MQPLIPVGISAVAVRTVESASQMSPIGLGPVRVLAHDHASGLTVIATCRGHFYAHSGRDLVMTFSEIDPAVIYDLFFSGAQCWVGDRGASTEDAQFAFALALDRSKSNKNEPLRSAFCFV